MDSSISNYHSVNGISIAHNGCTTIPLLVRRRGVRLSAAAEDEDGGGVDEAAEDEDGGGVDEAAEKRG